MTRSAPDARQPGATGCAPFLPLLPLLPQRMLDPQDEAALLAHLHTCAQCRARLRAYVRLDGGVRAYSDALASQAPPVEALIAAATGARAIPVETTQTSQPAPTLFLEKTVMESDTPAQPEAHVTPLDGNGRARRSRLRPSLAAVAALLLISLSALLFHTVLGASRGAHGGAPQPTATPTATALPPAPLHLPPGAVLEATSLSSPSDGWAAGRVYQERNGASVLGGIVAHFHNGQWTLYTDPALDAVPLDTVSMVSASEGWAGGRRVDGSGTAHGVLLHYAQGHWTQVDLPSRGTVTKVQMVSPTEGWALAGLHATDANACNPSCSGSGKGDPNGLPKPSGLLHYHNGAWSDEPLPVVTGDGWDVNIADISMLSADEGWAVSQNLILHYLHGAWSVAPSKTDITNLAFIRMVSDHDGWISGNTSAHGGGDGPPRLFHWDGAVWQQVALPPDADVQHNTIHPVVATTGEAWIFEGVYGQPGAVSLALRYHNGAWERGATPAGYFIYDGVAVASGELWAMAITPGSNPPETTLLHYRDGAWSVASQRG